MKPSKDWTIIDYLLVPLWKAMNRRLTKSKHDNITYPPKLFLTCENCYATHFVKGKDQVELKARGIPLPTLCGECRQQNNLQKRRHWRETSARFAAHEGFDHLWSSGKMNRQQAYAWMRKHFGFGSIQDAHIALLSEDQCLSLMLAVCLQHADVVPFECYCKSYDDAKKLTGKYMTKEVRTAAVEKSKMNGWGIGRPM